MLDIHWEPADRKLIDEGNLKFPRFYRQKISGDIVLFFTKTKATFLKPIKNGYELDSVYSDFCECTDDEQWQPIDVVLSNTPDLKEPGVVAINDPLVSVGIYLGESGGNYLGDYLVGVRFLILNPKNAPFIWRIYSRVEFKYVSLKISHTDEVSIVSIVGY